jgi:hypothetical protein
MTTATASAKNGLPSAIAYLTRVLKTPWVSPLIVETSPLRRNGDVGDAQEIRP